MFSQYMQSLSWPLTTHIGCGYQKCAMFSRTATKKLNNVDYYVCKFIPTEYIYDGYEDPVEEPCLGIGTSACLFCVTFQSDFLINYELLYYCGKLVMLVTCMCIS